MITTDQFRKLDYSDRNGGDVIGFPELKALDALIDAYATELKKKLRRKAAEGYGGWDDPKFKLTIEDKLHQHVQRGTNQYVDVGCLAAMLWNFEVGEATRTAAELEKEE